MVDKVYNQIEKMKTYDKMLEKDNNRTRQKLLHVKEHKLKV